MINFIICDDHKHIRNNVEKVIDKVMMNNTNAYKKHIFNDYNEEFNKIMNRKLASKVYILDIETKTSSGVVVANKIREKDVDCIIIFLTSHEEMVYEIIQTQLMCLTFIPKKDTYPEILEKAIKRSVEMVGKKQAIRFKHQGMLYTIPIKDILYITRDSVERKSLIVTDYGEFYIPANLSDVVLNLGSDFVQTHRSCYINKEHLKNMDVSDRRIIFDNDFEIDMLSETYKKEVIDLCCK